MRVFISSQAASVTLQRAKHRTRNTPALICERPRRENDNSFLASFSQARAWARATATNAVIIVNQTKSNILETAQRSWIQIWVYIPASHCNNITSFPLETSANGMQLRLVQQEPRANLKLVSCWKYDNIEQRWRTQTFWWYTSSHEEPMLSRSHMVIPLYSLRDTVPHRRVLLTTCHYITTHTFPVHLECFKQQQSVSLLMCAQGMRPLIVAFHRASTITIFSRNFAIGEKTHLSWHHS